VHLPQSVARAGDVHPYFSVVELGNSPRAERQSMSRARPTGTRRSGTPGMRGR